MDHTLSHQAEIYPGSGLYDICTCGHEGNIEMHRMMLGLKPQDYRTQ